MNRNATQTRIKSVFENTRVYDRASIVIPFAIISIALGVLAYRSYQLSVRMEKSLDSIAVQYLGYAGEVTARRADAAVQTAINTATQQWQEVGQAGGTPSLDDVHRWVADNNWIVSAIYLPDLDPVNAVYVSEPEPSAGQQRVTREFYTVDGTVRYTYDPARLLAYARRAVKQQPMINVASLAELSLPSRAHIELVPPGRSTGLSETPEGFQVIVPLAPPLEGTAVRAAIRTAQLASGWENYRTVSIAFAAIAFVLLAVGAGFAIRGLAREAEAMKLRAALIANISHELRTPLSMIRLGAETLKRGTQLREKDRQDLQDSILREVIHLNHLVENVLDVSRLQKSQKPPALTLVRPSELVGSLLTSYRSWIESRGFALESDIDEEIAEQMWDRDAVSRALLNLVDNAMKYSSTDRRIGVSLRDRETEIEIAVQDHGIGVSHRELKRIFEPYYRADFSDTETRRGAGLGLTLVYQIMRSHGGRVEVESVRGSGSTFRLIFPYKGRKTAEKASGSLMEARSV